MSNDQDTQILCLRKRFASREETRKLDTRTFEKRQINVYKDTEDTFEKIEILINLGRDVLCAFVILIFTSLVATVVCYRIARASYLGTICPFEGFFTEISRYEENNIRTAT